MTKEELRAVVDSDNGPGFSSNINLNGYIFSKNGSFIVLELRNIEDIRICHIKYIHTENESDFISVMVYAANFMMGNNVRFIYYKEKEREGTQKRLAFFKSLLFRQEVLEKPKWKYRFECNRCHDGCDCYVYSLYK